MNLDNIPKKSKKLMNQVSNAVEETGKKVVNQVSNLTENKAEEITEDAIIAAVDNAINVLQIASQRVRKENISTERVSLEVSVGITNVAHLKIKTDVPEKNQVELVDVEVTD